jgi:hypothetical protein
VTADEAVVAVLDALNGAGIPYMIVGSLASNFHGVPRSTREADIVVELAPGSLQDLAQRLPAVLTLDPQGAFETVTGTMRHVIVLAGSPFVCGLFVLGDDPHDRERFVRRIRTRVLDRSAPMATAEDMVITKLRWARDAGRTKDRDDVRNMLAVRGPEIDLAYVRRWTERHGTTSLLDEILASIG